MADFEAKAMDIQEKFELYVVSLTFTLLALSVQTASFGEQPIGDAFEILGWVILLISGIRGLLRLELVPVALRYYAASEQTRNDNKKYLEKIESKIASKSYFWLFITGLSLVILARSTSPLTQAFSYICNAI